MPLYKKSANGGAFAPIFAVAPMLDWTDRHCRYFYRQFSRHILLYTEMAVADAVLHGDRQRLLGFNPREKPLALQLGGSDPRKLAEAARIGESFGYDEINLNAGCPSGRVQAGAFGACLMLEPEKTARAVAAMKQAVSLPVTVKCRIGVDKDTGGESLRRFAAAMWAAGADGLWIHARNVWLQGLSPKENREVPPLNYQLVYALKQAHQNRFIGINGGIINMEQAKAQLTHADGVMLGRAVYHNPVLLAQADSMIYGAAAKPLMFQTLIESMAEYCDAHCAAGGRLSAVTRHMLGLFHGIKGAKAWRQILASKAAVPGAGSAVLREAFAQLNFSAAVSKEPVLGREQ